MVAMTDFAFLRHESSKRNTAANPIAQSYPCRYSRCPSAAFAKPSKQRKALRASAIYRSPMAAISSRMADVSIKEETRQSCSVEPKDSQTSCKARVEGKLQSPIVDHDQVVPLSPLTPSLTCVTESAGSCRGIASPSLSLSSLDDFDMPPTPRLRTCELPMSPSIIISPLPPLPPLHTSPHFEEIASEEPEFDPFNDEPFLRPFSNDWSSLDRHSSLSLGAEPSDEETWPFNNALGLYVDPAMNVATWDAGGFIRSTAPSPSPTRFRQNRHRR